MEDDIIIANLIPKSLQCTAPRSIEQLFRFFVKKSFSNTQPTNMKLLSFSFLALQATVHALELQIPISTSSAVKDIPHLGFGTWNLDKSNASEAVSVALRTGYRHIDCAAAYRNQKEVGKGLVDGMKKARIDRSEVWVTSKLWNEEYD